MTGIKVRTAAIFAAVLMFAAFFAVPAAAGGISVSSDILEPGEEFEVTITVPPSENADTASVKVKFDGKAFEVTEWEPEIENGVYGSTDGQFAVMSSNASRVIDLSDGLELTAWMKVREDAGYGTYTISLADASFCYVKDNGYEFEELWAPEDTEVTVEVCGFEDITDFIDDDFTDVIPEEPEEKPRDMLKIIISAVIIAVIVVAGMIVMKHRR